MQGQRVEDLGPRKSKVPPSGRCSPRAAGLPLPGPKGKPWGSDPRWTSLGLRGLETTSTTVTVLGILGAAHSSPRVAAQRSDGWAVPAPTAGPRS